MPALGMAQESGKIIEWLKSEGDAVVKGEPLISIETDKVNVEIEATASGILSGISAYNGDDVPVGNIIAWIATPGEAIPETANIVAVPLTTPEMPRRSGNGQYPQAPAPVLTPVAARVAAAHNIDPQTLRSDGNRVQKADVLSYVERQRTKASTLSPASPKARRMAQEHGLDIRAMRGSGLDGAVLTQDVMKAITATRIKSQPEVIEVASRPQLSPMWRVMADRITQSWREIPHFHLVRDVDAAALMGWYRSLQGLTPKVTYTDLLAKVVALALVQHPRLNASWQNDRIVYHEHVGIGLAVAVEDGLLVPVIRDANSLPLHEIAARRQAIISRAASGTLTVDDMQGGTFTISNLGMYGVDSFNAIINPPNSAILAIGRIADRIVPIGSVPAVRPMMTLNVACDHRVIDGARAAEFLATLTRFIENPLTAIY